MPDSEEFEPAPADIEQILAVETKVAEAVLGSDTDPDSKKVEVVVVALRFRARDADPEEEPLRTLIVFPAEDARLLRKQLEIADNVKTVAEQITSE